MFAASLWDGVQRGVLVVSTNVRDRMTGNPPGTIIVTVIEIFSLRWWKSSAIPVGDRRACTVELCPPRSKEEVDPKIIGVFFTASTREVREVRDARVVVIVVRI